MINRVSNNTFGHATSHIGAKILSPGEEVSLLAKATDKAIAGDYKYIWTRKSADAETDIFEYSGKDGYDFLSKQVKKDGNVSIDGAGCHFDKEKEGFQATMIDVLAETLNKIKRLSGK